MNIFDLHCDTISACFERRLKFLDSGCAVSLPVPFQRWIQVFAIFTPDEYRGEKALNYALDCAEYFKNSLEEVPFYQITDRGELGKDTGQFGAILAVENSSILNGKIENIKVFYDLGVRIMSLTWNGENELGSGCAGNLGLSEFGRKALDEMERLGIVADVSHLSEKGFWELSEHFQGKVAATHSNSKKICPHRRNLTDEQFISIKKSGGIVGINFYKEFVAEKESEQNLEGLIRHIDHFLSLGGEDVLALGSDYDGSEVIEEILFARNLDTLYNTLVKKGYQERLIEKITFENAFRFFKGALK